MDRQQMNQQPSSVRWIDPGDIEQFYLNLYTDFVSGLISSTDYEAALDTLKFRDEQHRYWTIGASSSQWYVYVNGAWQAAPPPAGLLLGPEITGLQRMPPELEQDALASRELEPVTSPAVSSSNSPPPSTGSLSPSPFQQVGDVMVEDKSLLSGAALPANAAPQKCLHCSQVLRAGAIFCTACGKRVIAEVLPPPAGSERRCSHCGHMVPAGANFCITCGTRVL